MDRNNNGLNESVVLEGPSTWKAPETKIEEKQAEAAINELVRAAIDAATDLKTGSGDADEN